MESASGASKPVNHHLSKIVASHWKLGWNARENPRVCGLLSEHGHIYLLQCAINSFFLSLSHIVWLSVGYLPQGFVSVASSLGSLHTPTPTPPFCSYRQCMSEKMGPSGPHSWVHSWRDRQWQLTHQRVCGCRDGWNAGGAKKKGK